MAGPSQKGDEIAFQVETSAAGASEFIVAVRGELDLYTAPQLKSELLRLVAGDATRIIVDLMDTTYIDSTSLGVMLGAVKRLRPAGGELVVVCADRNIRKIFEITLLDRVLGIYDTLPEALAPQPRPNDNGSARLPAA